MIRFCFSSPKYSKLPRFSISVASRTLLFSKKLPRFSVASRTLLFSAFSALLLARVAEPPPWLALRDTTSAVSALSKLLLIASLLCLMITAELRLLQLSSTVTFGVLALLHSIPIVLCGVVFFGDRVTVVEVVGFALCLGGGLWYMQILREVREGRGAVPGGEGSGWGGGTRGKGEGAGGVGVVDFEERTGDRGGWDGEANAGTVETGDAVEELRTGVDGSPVSGTTRNGKYARLNAHRSTATP